MTPEAIKQIIAEKVAGKIEPQHSAEGHFYRFVGSGKLVASVTTIFKEVINKPHIVFWAIKRGIEWLETDNRWSRLSDPAFRADYIVGAQQAHIDERDDAGNVGTTAHALIERYIKHWLEKGEKVDIRSFQPGMTLATTKGLITVDPRAIAAARAFEHLVAKHMIIPLASEILVGDSRYSAGTLDFLCMWDGKLTLADFKTSNNLSKDYALQTAAYKAFFDKMTGLKIRQIKIVHLSKDMDKFAVWDVPRPARAYSAFKKLCGFYAWWRSESEKLTKDIKRIKI